MPETPTGNQEGNMKLKEAHSDEDLDRCTEFGPTANTSTADIKQER